MSVTLAGDILQTARAVYLNDRNATEATDDILLPFLKQAYGFLEAELNANGVQCTNEEVIAIIPANTDEYYPLPGDLVVPNTMFERMVGSIEEFVPMEYRMNLPTVISTTYLKYWTYRLDRILLVPATIEREIKLYYQRSFPAVETVDDALFGKAEHYLTAKVAALYNLFVRQSETLASVCESVASNELAEIVNMQVKSTQAQVIRRKPYVPFRRS
jgi:hypothetical protein